MATKKNYSRYFIILQEEEKGYSLASDKLPSGYAKFEIKNDKCKISYYVQNLKKEMGPYYMILICNKKDVKKLIKIGEMNIDDYGRTEVSYEYGIDNVAGSNIAVEKVVGAAIVKYAGSNIIPVMSGFITTEAPENWKVYTVFDNDSSEKVAEVSGEEPTEVENIEIETINEPEAETITPETANLEIRKEENENKVVAEPYEIVEEIINEEVIKPEAVRNDAEETVKDISNEDTPAPEEKSIFDSYEESILNEKREEANVKENIEEVEEKVEEKIEEKVEERHDHHHHKEDEHKEYEEWKDELNYPKGPLGDYFKLVADGFEEIHDLCMEIKRCKWYKVPVQDKKDLCDISDYNKYTVVYYPMYAYYKYIKKHGHYILGYKCDTLGRMKYLVYGIPGRKAIIDQPFEGRSGFVTWIPLISGDESENSEGYWLMFYDFKNRTIVIPVKA